MLSTARRLLFVLSLFICALPMSAQVVISQVYGGGGNSGATYKNDFIEIFNRGNSPVSLAGWSVQYASAAGTTWTNITNLSGTLQPGQYYLVQEAAGAGGTTSLPTPDATGSIAMSGTDGKVALVSSTVGLSGACPTGGAIQDFVGYGTASCFETAAVAALNNTTAALRNSAGCTDTNSNLADFTRTGPTPRNSATALHTCGLSISNSSPLPDATIGTFYSVTFTGTGGTGSGYSFSLLSGTVPPGLNLVGPTLSGTPTSDVGSPFNFTIQVTDSASTTGSKAFQITVKPASTPPTGSGSATPNSLQAGSNTLLVVNVTLGTNPASTGISVSGDLSAIGGSASQPFYDDATHGDVTANDNKFSFLAAVSAGTTTGAKSLPITIADAQSRSTSASIALTVQPPPPPHTIKISQVYGGGGNSGSTYTNDFIEIFNQATTPIDLTGWSVQQNSAADTDTWAVTPLCSASPCILQPGHYFLVKESAGAGGTTPLPAADATGSILMGAGSGKIALVADTTPLAGGCPTGGAIADMVGYGSTATCSETAPTGAPSNTAAVVRKGNGCVDTDNNFNDFVVIGPLPRNSASPAQGCGGDATQPSALGLASPSTLDPASNTLLTVKVIPATTPASTNLAVVADLTSIGGSATQQFYDDGTHGDVAAGDNTFSFATTVGAALSTGAKGVLATVTDAQARTTTAPITLTIQSPTCGVERWSVKVGTDPDAASVNLTPVRGNIFDLGAITPPADPPGPPDNARLSPTETTVFVVNALMTFYKKEDDVDYHIVLKDAAGHTLIAEIPSPACILKPGSPRVLGSSPFAAGIAAARANFDSHLTATTFFQTANVPVQIKGVGFFDFIHGQTGVAPNGIELHPVLEINFTTPTTTVLASVPNPSQYGQSVVVTATVSNGGVSTPTGHVSLYDGGTLLATSTLDGAGKATFNTTSLSVGSHSLTATYEGDNTSAESTSDVLTHNVVPADQLITFAALGDKTYGDAAFTVSATGGGSGNPVTFVASGNCTSTGVNGHTITITGAGSCTVTASQAGNANYNAATDVVRSFTIAKATASFSNLSSPVITVGATPTTLSGTLNLGVLVPTGSVAITLNGVTQNAAILVGGSFSSSFATGALAPANPPYAITYSYAGDSNFNAASGSGTLTVGYGITPLYDQAKASQAGSTIPIKLVLTNLAGTNLSSASVVVTAIRLVLVSTSAVSDVQASGNANPDNNFRFDGSGYIFNLSTKGLASGTYRLVFTVSGDPTEHTVSFQIR